MKIDVKAIWNEKFKKKIQTQQFDPFLKKELNEFLKKLSKDASVLDLGCGVGDKTAYMVKRGLSVVGLDASPEAIAHAKKKFPRIHFSTQDAVSTKCKDASVDAIVSIAVFHCLLEKDREKYVREMKRILKKGGLLFQIVLSSEDETMRSGKEIEPNTFLQGSGTPFHLFTKKELQDFFSDFTFLKLSHHKESINNMHAAVHIMILKNE